MRMLKKKTAALPITLGESDIFGTGTFKGRKKKKHK